MHLSAIQTDVAALSVSLDCRAELGAGFSADCLQNSSVSQRVRKQEVRFKLMRRWWSRKCDIPLRQAVARVHE
jgi:hypothetical protein